MQNNIFLHHTLGATVSSSHVGLEHGVELIGEPFVKNSRGPNHVVAARVSSRDAGSKTRTIRRGDVVGTLVLSRRYAPGEIRWLFSVNTEFVITPALCP